MYRITGHRHGNRAYLSHANVMVFDPAFAKEYESRSHAYEALAKYLLKRGRTGIGTRYAMTLQKSVVTRTWENC